MEARGGGCAGRGSPISWPHPPWVYIMLIQGGMWGWSGSWLKCHGLSLSLFSPRLSRFPWMNVFSFNCLVPKELPHTAIPKVVLLLDIVKFFHYIRIIIFSLPFKNILKMESRKLHIVNSTSYKNDRDWKICHTVK